MRIGFLEIKIFSTNKLRVRIEVPATREAGSGSYCKAVLERGLYFFINAQHRLLLKHGFVQLPQAVYLPGNLCGVFMQVYHDACWFCNRCFGLRIEPASRGIDYRIAFFKDPAYLVIPETTPFLFGHFTAAGF